MKDDSKRMSLEQYKEIYGDKMEEMMKDIVSHRQMPKMPFEELFKQSNKNEETDKSK